MTNENCLAGIKCPKCGQEERFHITAVITCDVTDEGSEPTGDHFWDEKSVTQCTECGESGPLERFSAGKVLPPDPEGMNTNRAAWAGQAITTFMLATGTDREDAICDLLADIMHWCDRTGFDFNHELERGRDHYTAETLPEPEQEEEG